jgi:hypothetical protein
LLLGLALLVATPATAAILYVQGLKAVLYAEPRLGAARVAEVGRGEALTELEAAGGWYRVQAGSRVGWVSRLAVGAKEKGGSVSLLAADGEALEAGARRRASSFTTAAAARGLAEDRARLSQKFRVNYDQVEAMERSTVSTEEALAFIHQRGTP